MPDQIKIISAITDKTVAIAAITPIIFSLGY